MKPSLLAVRRCAIALALVHLAIFASFFVPYLPDPRENLWQVLLPPWNGLFAFSRAPFIILASIMFLPLLYPLFASWVAVRSPLKIMSLVSARISLPLIFVAWFFWVVLALELYAPASGLQGFLRLVLFAPSAAFVFSFLLCLVLARRLRRLRMQGTPLRMRQSAQKENQASEEGAEVTYVATGRLLPSTSIFLLLSALGLLCQVLAILSLFLPYTETYDSYKGISSHITGWQTLGLKFPFAIVVLFLILIPLLPTLASLLLRLPVALPFVQKDTLQRGSIYLSYWLTMVCFILSSIILEYSLLFIGADFNKETRWLDAAFGIPAIALLLALLWSGVLRVYTLRFSDGSATEIRPSREIVGL